MQPLFCYLCFEVEEYLLDFDFDPVFWLSCISPLSFCTLEKSVKVFIIKDTKQEGTQTQQGKLEYFSLSL